jgi:hypothetical protein
MNYLQKKQYKTFIFVINHLLMTTTLEPKAVKPNIFQVIFRHGKPLRLLAEGLSQ